MEFIEAAMLLAATDTSVVEPAVQVAEKLSSQFFDMPVFDNDFYKLTSRFIINFVFLAVLVRGVYYKHSGRKDYLFSYIMINVIVFFICFTLKKLELELGMALGLFAVFGILRYRTDAIPIKEMTYLFMVIGLAVVNSLANRKMSYAELAFTNIGIVGLAAMLETIPLLKREVREVVLYEKIELIKPGMKDQLVADLQERTGLKISRLELGKIDFLRDTVSIAIYYYPHEQESDIRGEVDVSRRAQNR